MASGTLSADKLREKQRWGDGNKVYRRKNYKKGLKNTAASTTTNTPPTSNNDNDNNISDAAVSNNDNNNATTAVPAIGGNNEVATTPTPETNDNDEICTTTTTIPKINGDNNDNNKEAIIATSNNDKEENNSNANNDLEQSSQTLATEETNLSQQQSLLRINAASENSSTQNCLPEVSIPRGEAPSSNGTVKPVLTRVGDRVKIDLGAAKSKNEIQELRRKLASEVDQVRSSLKSLDAKEIQVRHSLRNFEAEEPQLVANEDLVQPTPYYDHSQYPSSDLIDTRALVRSNPAVSSMHLNNPRPFRHLSVSVVENHNHAVSEYSEREKRTPKANPFYQNSDFLLAKDRLPPESNKKPKSNVGKKHNRGDSYYGFGIDRYRNQVFKNCSNLLQRLMKHKHGWVFNEPVNAKLLGLHDYHDIIKHPMDLGTVKTRLSQNFYKSPREFAEDIRLTFNNAMTYNPKGQDVHVMAEQLSNIFEERWPVIETEYFGSTTPNSRKLGTHYLPPQMRNFDRLEAMKKPMNFPPVSRTPVPKKPKAKDLNKRDMTWEEKQKLSTHLQSLPSEKLDSIVQIIKKRNSTLSQHDDEIEVDIDSVDAETLWELDRFVTNYKKSLSKNKRKAENALQSRAESGHTISTISAAHTTLEASKERRTVQKNAASSSPRHIEKQGDNVSRSSSSSSSSSDSGSSSSDSDSDSSSADGSDAGHSPRS